MTFSEETKIVPPSSWHSAPPSALPMSSTQRTKDNDPMLEKAEIDKLNKELKAESVSLERPRGRKPKMPDNENNDDDEPEDIDKKEKGGKARKPKEHQKTNEKGQKDGTSWAAGLQAAVEGSSKVKKAAAKKASAKPKAKKEEKELDSEEEPSEEEASDSETTLSPSSGSETLELGAKRKETKMTKDKKKTKQSKEEENAKAERKDQKTARKEPRDTSVAAIW